MNYCGCEQKSAMAGGYEERERMMMMMESVVCPKPRKLRLLNPSLCEQIRPLRLSTKYIFLRDPILGGYVGEKPGCQVASSPPFYCGSPPSRASNPVIQDAQFGSEKITPLFPAPPSPAPSSTSARKGGSCVRMKFGDMAAAVRIEGFDCHTRDQRNCSISAVA
ncbi:hypothetical protein SADUNF_Sadunf12G0041700 [Salix dunnii]|uniref:Uncharacterized protein n=1 Tax=Salix dunnii TaxID=1413687 RepID=A0A835JMY7_9ROSI|nr:hypothetical protein SADUNF_Sadunf12G0041700 [Salix dunnii]